MTKHLTDPRYSSMLTAVAHTILDLYAIAVSAPAFSNWELNWHL